MKLNEPVNRQKLERQFHGLWAKHAQLCSVLYQAAKGENLLQLRIISRGDNLLQLRVISRGDNLLQLRIISRGDLNFDIRCTLAWGYSVRRSKLGTQEPWVCTLYHLAGCHFAWRLPFALFCFASLPMQNFCVFVINFCSQAYAWKSRRHRDGRTNSQTKRGTNQPARERWVGLLTQLETGK